MANDSYVGVGPADRDPTVSDDSVTTSKIQDNAVTGPKIAMTSDAAGDILTYTGTDYVRLGIGSVGQALKVASGGTAVEWATDASGTGDVVGPGSSTDDALAKFDTTTGKLLQNSNATLTDAGVLTVSNIAATIDTTTQNSVTTMTGLTTVGTIGTGTWQGTAIANAYIGTTIDATKLADGTVTNAEFQYINSLSSNAQTQINAKGVGDALLGSAQEWTAQQNFNNTTLTFDATQDWALAANQVATLTLTANTIFDAPTQMVDGAFYSLIIIQDGTGGWTTSWNGVFKWAAATAPTLTTTAAAKDILVWRSDGVNMYEVGRQLNVSQPHVTFKYCGLYTIRQWF